MSTNNTKPEGKEIDIESQLIEELSQNGTDKLRKLFLQWQSERTARLEQFNQTLQLLIDKPQLSPSDHTAPQGEEEQVKLWKEAIDLIEVFADDVSKIHNDAIHVVANQFTIQKKQPLTKLSEGSDK